MVSEKDEPWQSVDKSAVGQPSHFFNFLSSGVRFTIRNCTHVSKISTGNELIKAGGGAMRDWLTVFGDCSGK